MFGFVHTSAVGAKELRKLGGSRNKLKVSYNKFLEQVRPKFSEPRSCAYGQGLIEMFVEQIRPDCVLVDNAQEVSE